MPNYPKRKRLQKPKLATGTPVTPPATMPVRPQRTIPFNPTMRRRPATVIPNMPAAKRRVWSARLGRWMLV
jgi:hypothetical protein